MAKKSTKIALTYVITILATFLIIGGIFYYIMQYMMNPTVNEQEISGIEPVMDTEEFVPSDGNSSTTLFILDSGKKLSSCCFAAVRMSAEERKLIIMPVPADTYAEIDGNADSIYDFYRNGGAVKAADAVSAALGVDMDYYVKLDNDSFRTLADIFGGVDYTIPYNLMYEDPDTKEEIIFREGETYISSDDMIKLFTFPKYNSGEEYRAKFMGLILTDLINKNVSMSFSYNIDSYFNMVINSSIDTNYTAYDYKEQSDTMKYIADSEGRIADLVTVSGTYNEDSLFVLDENFVKAVPEWLKLRTDT